MSEARFFHIAPDGKMKRVPSLEELQKLLQGGGYAWLDYFDPAKEDLLPSSSISAFTPSRSRTAWMKTRFPRSRIFPGTRSSSSTAAGTGRRAGAGGDGFHPREELPGHGERPREGSLNFFEKVEQGVALEPSAVRRGPDFLLHVILDFLVDHKFAAIETLQDAIDTAEEEILKDPGTFQPDLLMRLRRELLTLRKSLFHERENPGQDLPPRLPLHLREGHLPLPGHLRPPGQVFRGGGDLPGDDHEPHGDVPLHDQQPHGGDANRTNHTVRRLTVIIRSSCHSHCWPGSGDVRVEHDDRPVPLENLLSRFPPGHDRHRAVNWYILKRVEARKGDK